MIAAARQHRRMSPPIHILPMRGALRPATLQLQLEPNQHPYVPPIAQVLNRAQRKADVREMVILRERTVVGYFQLNLSPRETAHYCSGPGSCGLEAMMVDRRLQAQGIGHAALVQLPDLVELHLPAYDRIYLTVNASNRPAQKLYLRCGFVDSGAVYEGAPSGAQHIYVLQLSPARARSRESAGSGSTVAARHESAKDPFTPQQCRRQR